MLIQHCDYYEPLTGLGGVPSSTEPFQFSQADCFTIDDTQQLISAPENASTSFVLSKTISYGDFITTSFLLLFLVFGIASFLLSWFIPKKLDWKQH